MAEVLHRNYWLGETGGWTSALQISRPKAAASTRRRQGDVPRRRRWARRAGKRIIHLFPYAQGGVQTLNLPFDESIHGDLHQPLFCKVFTRFTACFEPYSAYGGR